MITAVETDFVALRCDPSDEFRILFGLSREYEEGRRCPVGRQGIKDLRRVHRMRSVVVRERKHLIRGIHAEDSKWPTRERRHRERRQIHRCERPTDRTRIPLDVAAAHNQRPLGGRHSSAGSGAVRLRGVRVIGVCLSGIELDA